MGCIYFLLTFSFSYLAAGFGSVATHVSYDAQGGDDAQEEENGRLSRGGSPPKRLHGQHHRRHRVAAVVINVGCRRGCVTDRHLRRLSGPGRRVMLSSSVRMGGAGDRRHRSSRGSVFACAVPSFASHPETEGSAAGSRGSKSARGVQGRPPFRKNRE